jgi:hypothetical protein
MPVRDRTQPQCRFAGHFPDARLGHDEWVQARVGRGVRFSERFERLSAWPQSNERAGVLIAIAGVKIGTTQGSACGNLASCSPPRCRPALLYPSLSFCIQGRQAVEMGDAPGDRHAAIALLPPGLAGWHS